VGFELGESLSPNPCEWKQQPLEGRIPQRFKKKFQSQNIEFSGHADDDCREIDSIFFSNKPR